MPELPGEACGRGTNSQGIKIGGISPFGQARKIPAVIEEHALEHDLVYVNGGKRGLQVRLQVPDLVSALNAIVAPIVA